MTHYSEDDYKARLIQGGMSPELAADLARTYAQSGNLPTKQSVEEESGEPAAVVTAPPKISARDRELIEASLKIKEEAPSGNDMTFMHSIMCQVGLPRSKVNGLEFERICGAAGVYIRAGKIWDGKNFVQQPVPYGTMPRMIMAYVNTFALRNKTPEVEVGNSASDMLRRLGKSTNGGKRSAFDTFRVQTKALAACSMTLGFSKGDIAFTYDGKPIKQFEAWLSNNDDQQSLWPGVITLSDEYFRTLSEHAVPLDMRALMALKGSALSMDIYAMLADRLHRISGRPLYLHWKSLREQFGQEYKGANGDKDFKTAFSQALKKVLAVYPEAAVKVVNGGLMLGSSPPPVPYKLT